MIDRPTEQQHPCDKLDAGRVDHAASYLRERLNHGQYAGMDGRYAGYTLCALLDVLARELRCETGLSAPIRSALAAVVSDLGREELTRSRSSALRD